MFDEQPPAAVEQAMLTALQEREQQFDAYLRSLPENRPLSLEERANVLSFVEQQEQTLNSFVPQANWLNSQGFPQLTQRLDLSLRDLHNTRNIYYQMYRNKLNVRHLEEMQLRMKALGDQSVKAFETILAHPAEAYKNFKALIGQVDSTERDHEAWASTHFTEPPDDQEKQARRDYRYVQELILQYRALIFLGIGNAAMLLGNLDEAQQWCMHSLELWDQPFSEFPLKEQEKKQWKAMLHSDLGFIFLLRNSLESAAQFYELAQQEATDAGDVVCVVQALEVSAICALLQGNREVYSQKHSEALHKAKTHRDKALQTNEVSILSTLAEGL